MSFHPPITDLADWNTALTQCGCCPMPECELPLLECQSSYFVPCVLFADNGTGTKMWKKSRYTPTPGADIIVHTWSGDWVLYEDYAGCDIETTEPAEEEDVNELLEEVTCDDLLAILGDVEPTFEEESVGAGCIAQYQCSILSASASATFVRYRWKIPPCHPGSWYQIEWDEVFFPQAYLDWYAAALADIDGIEVFDPNASPPPELPVLTPKAYTWTGAALGPCDEEDPENDYDFRSEIIERISPWSNVVVPPAAGEVEIRNARVRCYQNPFGTVAQTIPGFDVFSLANFDQDSNLDENEPI